MNQYQQFVASCRAIVPFRSADCTEGNAKVADAQVRDAIIQANTGENGFLRKWGSEAFVGVVCH